ncbi:tetratricopeptide repeat protein [Marinobacter sp. SS5-14b]|uniref:tetratricopeptide repeat protein n=1 Tax=Marinobacter sp. SS5-14b TaxID=3050456 RepID=UPI0026DF0815|nr:tetratricopeptide repeat protein [Marinobacter sp. SS5-14b]
MTRKLISFRICVGLVFAFITVFAQAETNDDRSEALFQEGYTLYQQQYSPNAFEKFKQAAQLGHVEAAYYAGNILRRNHTYITEEAEQFYRQAAEGGDVYAMLRLARKGNYCGTLRNCDYDREEWLERALDSVLPKAEAGDLDAMKDAYSVYRVSGDKGEAWGWIQRAAEGGHAFSQYWLAILLEEQDMGFYWTEASRRADILKWLKTSAEQGFPKAMLKLALEYKEDGRFDEANEWVDLLGQTDYFEALFNYGLILLQGPEGMFQYPEARPVEGLAVLLALHRETGDQSVKYSIDRHLNDLDSDTVTKARARSEELLVDTPILHYLPKFGI